MRKLLSACVGFMMFSSTVFAKNVCATEDCSVCPTGFTQNGSVFTLGSPSGYQYGSVPADICTATLNQARNVQRSNGLSVCTGGDLLFIVGEGGTISPGSGSGYMGLDCGCFGSGGGYYCWASINSSSGVCCTPN